MSAALAQFAVQRQAAYVARRLDWRARVEDWLATRPLNGLPRPVTAEERLAVLQAGVNRLRDLGAALGGGP